MQQPAPQDQAGAFWGQDPGALLQALGASDKGLTGAEAAQRALSFGPNALGKRTHSSTPLLLLGQFRSPIVLLLVGAAILAAFLKEATDTVIIMVIVLASGLLGFWQEHGAADAVQKLLAIVRVKALVLRDGQELEIPVEEIVPGDVVVLNAGDVIPGDCLILESVDLFVDEATLTGETFPQEKQAGVVEAATPIAGRTNSLFMGTHVVSGTAQALVVRTGQATELGKVSQRLALRPAETEFERGVRRFGFLLMQVTLVMVFAIFAVNVLLQRSPIESLLFSLAIAVGLTPQLLPAIITVNLAHGARQMANEKVIVKRLVAIENFGSMNVLCSDKTGTLTEGEVHVRSAMGPTGEENQDVLRYAAINAHFESGFTNPIDTAIRAHCDLDLTEYQKVDEVPYDFVRKRLSILVQHAGGRLMVTKGALNNILAVCDTVDAPAGGSSPTMPLDSDVRQRVDTLYATLSAEGLRVLGVAHRELGPDQMIDKDSETQMTFAGFVTLYDPPKAGAGSVIAMLRKQGVTLKVITGDNALVAASVSKQVGLENARVVSGAELEKVSDQALLALVGSVDIFAEVEPNHKERIIAALRRAGNIVGYMGDGINDASALHAADVGISVESAVDVAKDAADIVLLEKDLEVLSRGVYAGRVTFANTLKYVFMATSANFGNMFSMAGASLFLPFLPLLPKQILLTNLLTDLPEMTIATDSVDTELVERPRRWDIRFIRNFMIVFGLLSSIFDYLTFGLLYLVLHPDQAHQGQFQAGWFLESVASAALVVLVIRTRRPFFRSKPGKLLAGATLLVVLVVLALPYTPLGPVFGFGRLPVAVIAIIAAIVAAYVVAAELAKAAFYRRIHG